MIREYVWNLIQTCIIQTMRVEKDFDDSYILYNMLEKSILFDEFQDFQLKINKNILYEFDKKIKILAMQLQRIKPSEWNNFIDLAMNQN